MNVGRLAGQATALGVVAVLLFVLGARHGLDAFVAGVGLTLAGGLTVAHGRPPGDEARRPGRGARTDLGRDSTP